MLCSDDGFSKVEESLQPIAIVIAMKRNRNVLFNGVDFKILKIKFTIEFKTIPLLKNSDSLTF